MKTKIIRLTCFLTALLALATVAHAQSTAFTYQGRLNDGAGPATGLYDLKFELYDLSSSGTQQGGFQTKAFTDVTNGLFTVKLDFGNQFPGADRWLEIQVRTNGGSVFTVLAPRQLVTATPYAITSINAGTAATVSGNIPVGQVTGTIPLAQLPAGLVTNGASGVNITGTFNGDGAGVSNLNLVLNTSGSIRSPEGDFFVKSTPGVGTGPTAVTAADVNGDGKLDLISANAADATLSVLTNNGSGGFVLASSPSVGLLPFCVTATDVNGDGKSDLISANYNANTLSVLTNNGSGGFVLASSPGVGLLPYWVTAADVNGDGRPDLISANYLDFTLTVLTNNGSGGFVLASSPGVGPTPFMVVSSDVNGDGKLDLISANSGNNTLTVLTNTANGVFVLASSLGVGGAPRSVAAADVNGDGKPDLICGNSFAQNGNFNFNTLSVLTNNGSGGFVLASTLSVGTGPQAVMATDVNGDGKVDLISANAADATLSVLTNNGSGGFVLSSAPSVPVGAASATTADVNGDGRPDVISVGANKLSVLFNAIEFDGVFNGAFVGYGQFSTASITTASIGTASFGASLSQKLNLYGTSYGIGIQSGVLYSRVATGGGFAWFAGGTHDDGTYNAGSGGTVRMRLDSGGLVVNGLLVPASDRNLKENFAAVRPREMLEKVVALPLSSWNLKADPATRHVGPMAQDFYAAFNLGADDKHIATVDADGVALAAIQGLNTKVESGKQKAEMEMIELRAENTALKARLEKLERMMNEKNGGAK